MVVSPLVAAQRQVILGLAATASATYFALALSGDLRGRPLVLVPALVVLLGAMLAAWRIVRGDLSLVRIALPAALVFRVVASLGGPALSDDLYRYLWDGRVQLHGIHPYALPPSDPRLEPLRTGEIARAVNHPDVPTIYPPLGQWLFLALAALDAGVVQLKLVMGLVDFGVILVLVRLLRRSGLPADRIVLYAWNPLAVLETAGSGHLEPVGVLMLVAATLWLLEGRRGRAIAAYAASIHVKLLPLLLLPVLARRQPLRAVPLLAAALIVPVLPFALTGPAAGGGLRAYAERWEHNAPIYPLVESFVERSTARQVVGCAALAWAAIVAWGLRTDLVRQALWVLGGTLLLSPTLHPWYLLWILPYAAALASPGWLALAATCLSSYGGPPGEVGLALKLAEFVPPLAVALWSLRRAR